VVCPLFAQSTVGTDSIVGTVTDPSAAVLGGAKVSITNLATGNVMSLTTNSAGAYNSGARTATGTAFVEYWMPRKHPRRFAKAVRSCVLD